MILSAGDIQALQRGELGEAVVDDPPIVGTECWIRESPRQNPVCRATVVDVWPLQGGGSAVLLERVAETFVLTAKERRPRPALNLTRAQRTKLFAGEVPHIGGEGRCPIDPGATLRLSARVTLEVRRVNRNAKGEWSLVYTLTDTRDPVRLLRRTPPAHREGDELDIGDQGAIREAAVQSFYTTTPGAAIEDAGEAPDREWVELKTKTQREFDHQRRLARHAEKLRERSKLKTRRKRAA